MSNKTQTPAEQHVTTEAMFKSGEGEIRTLDTLSGIPVFETGAFGHSATSPGSLSGTQSVLVRFA